ncbi:uncharacterized protein LOC122507071 [Leptopilina heterotoma]|uniref:uncharacterized protein LOC122507071 n=1 Tax=Leptopilina heterotoma TaxID=63436 RepID=UPI001CA88F5F|nr:uncharacterized protein LOC122507071 [Leptopilina heterotoma]
MENSNAPNVNDNASSQAELPVLRLESTLEQLLTDLSDPAFGEESPGLVVLKKEDFQTILLARRLLAINLNEANTHNLKLEEELSEARKFPPPPMGNFYEEQFKAVYAMANEKQRLTEDLFTAQNNTRKHEEEVAKLRQELEAFEYDWDDLLKSHKNFKRQAALAKNYKDLFRQTITEVYTAQANMREPCLRKKLPPGCINCKQEGHSHNSCPESYSGKFCQECDCPDFNTQDCPWPHYENKKIPSLPPHLRCKRCTMGNFWKKCVKIKEPLNEII